MTEPIKLREIASLPTHGDQKCPLTGVQGIPYIAITPEERDALVTAVRALKWVCDANNRKELCSRAGAAERWADRFTDN